MKSRTVVRLMFTALTLGLAITQSKAQSFGDILSAGVEDANTYLENYAAPAVNSFGVGLSGGWYNTAKPHKLLGFDITTSVNMAAIPDEEMMFNFAEAGFQNLQLDQTGDNMIPTLVGGEATTGSEIFIPANTTITDPRTGQSITIDDEIRFDTPNGFNLEDVPVATGIPAPTVQLGIGLIKNTDLKIRLLPEQTIDDYSFKMFGIGVMHDVKQWIPAIKNLPFDLSGFFGTTTMTATTALDVDIENSQSNGAGGTSTTTFMGSGKATFKTNSTTVQAIISKKLAVFTPYAAIGFNAVKTTFDVAGDYEFETDADDRFSGDEQTQMITDPVDLEFTGAGGARFTVGARLKLLIFTFHGAYTLQKYNNFNAGVGISIR